jgi:hypothetical protein
MTSDTGKDQLGAGGADRPHATLDLKATEIFPERKAESETPGDTVAQPDPEPQAALPPADELEPQPAPANEPEPQLEAEPEPAASSIPPRSTGDSGAGVASFFTHMTAGLIGAVVALGLFFVLGNLRDRLPFLTNRAAEDLGKTVAAAEQRIAALEAAARTSKGEASGADLRIKAAGDQANALKQDFATLAGRIETLEGRPVPAGEPSAEGLQQSLQPLEAKLADLNNRVGALAKAQEELRAATGMAALTMAVQNLRRAVADGKPFAAELKTLAALAPEPLEVSALEARRESGLANLGKLQRDFDAAAKTALDAAQPAGDGSFTGDLLAKARSLVRVRPTGEIPGDGPDAVLARAGHRLDNGDLPGAIRETDQLTGPAAAAMAPWLTEAKARAAADDALAKLEARLASAPGADARVESGG